MRRTPDDELADLMTLIADRLSATGWTRRALAGPDELVAVRPYASGMLASVEVRRASLGLRNRWPVGVALKVGATPAGATDLATLLTLWPKVAFEKVDTDFRPSISGPEQFEEVTDRVVDLVATHAPGVIGRFPDVRSVVDAWRPTTGSPDVLAEWLVLLAATGRTREVREHLQRFDPEDDEDRRFVRQLVRWLDAGAPTPPPAEQTLLLLPPRDVEPADDFAQIRANSRDRRAAREAVRAQSGGLGADDVRIALEREYAARGVEVSASGVEAGVEALLREREPLGGLRNAVRAFGLLRDAGVGIARAVRDPDERTTPTPWADRPDRAAYPVAAGRDRWLRVRLDDPLPDAITRVLRAPAAASTIRTLHAWVGADAAGEFVVHVGRDRVGVVDRVDAAVVARVAGLAAHFDEDPVFRARLSQWHDGTVTVLELARPRFRHGGPSDQDLSGHDR